MPKKSFGFTLIELLITISIISIISAVGYVEYKTFSASQILGSSLNEVQSMLRIAQNNATTSLKASNNSILYVCKNWIVEFETNSKDIKLICQPADATLADISNKTLTLPTNVTISSISSSCNITYPAYSASVAFSSLYGKPSFILARSVANFECFSTSDMTITLTYQQGSGTSFSKNIVVSKGGGIDVK